MANKFDVLMALAYAGLALLMGLLGYGFTDPELFAAPHIIVVCFAVAGFCMWKSGCHWQRAYENVEG